jgi:hypothetical protein
MQTKDRSEGLKTEAWVYLNVRHPVCAWAAYRGVLVAAPTEPGFLSVWAASMLASDDAARAKRELSLEAWRQAHFPQLISRLTGMYCFTDLRSAELALQWGGPNNHFKAENLADLSLAQARISGARHDANWISHSSGPNWEASYWQGIPHPGFEPIWETLALGRMYILGTSIRDRAQRLLTRRFPDSVVLLESARVAAWLGSDLGSVAGFLFDRRKKVRLEYLIDMREAGDRSLAERMRATTAEQGVPIDRDVFQKALQIGAFKTPDFRPFGFSKPKSALPFIDRGMKGPAGFSSHQKGPDQPSSLAAALGAAQQRGPI